MGLVMGCSWIWRLIRAIEKGMMESLGLSPHLGLMRFGAVESLEGRYLGLRTLEDRDALKGRDSEMDRHEWRLSPHLQY